ncbi:MAG TPA: helix-turn-helix domain-containing protein [Terriglobales bacterium]|nr:helix-turn-helix domain-containing protein [Terriglobales bacterium]
MKEKSIRCLLDVVDLPPENFAMADDGRQRLHACRQRKALVVVLAKYANADGSRSYPSTFTMAKALGVSRRTVFRLLNDLRDLGFLNDGAFHEIHKTRVRSLNVSKMTPVTTSNGPVTTSPVTGDNFEPAPVPSSRGPVTTSRGPMTTCFVTQPPVLPPDGTPKEEKALPTSLPEAGASAPDENREEGREEASSFPAIGANEKLNSPEVLERWENGTQTPEDEAAVIASAEAWESEQIQKDWRRFQILVAKRTDAVGIMTNENRAELQKWVRKYGPDVVADTVTEWMDGRSTEGLRFFWGMFLREAAGIVRVNHHHDRVRKLKDRWRAVFEKLEKMGRLTATGLVQPEFWNAHPELRDIFMKQNGGKFNRYSFNEELVGQAEMVLAAHEGETL